MSKNVNVLVMLQAEVLATIGAAVLADKTIQQLVLAGQRKVQAEAEFAAGKVSRLLAQNLRTVFIPKLEDERGALLNEQGKIVTNMRDSENAAVDEILALPESRVIAYEYKGVFATELLKGVRTHLRLAPKYLGWVTRGQEIQSLLEMIKKEIEHLEQDADKADQDGDMFSSLGREFAAEAKSIESAFYAS